MWPPMEKMHPKVPREREQRGCALQPSPPRSPVPQHVLSTLCMLGSLDGGQEARDVPERLIHVQQVGGPEVKHGQRGGNLLLVLGRGRA